MNDYEKICSKLKLDNNAWNNLESNIYTIFKEILACSFKDFKSYFKIKYNKSKELYFIRLKKGYLVFSYLTSQYYISETNLLNNHSKNEGINKITRFLNLTQKEDIILSLNYTNFIKLFEDNDLVLNSKLFLLHYITTGLFFWNYNLNILSPRKNTEILNYSILGDWQSFDILVDFNSLSTDIVRKKYINQIEYRKSPLNVNINTKKAFQLNILGNELVKEEKLIFLSKNRNPYLFIQNYPKNVLKKITDELKYTNKDCINKTLYIFGYSFSNSDYQVNKFIANLIRDNYKLIILFFKEDQNNINLIKNTFNNIKRFYKDSLFKNLEYDYFIKKIIFFI
ncbi:hypothetical protein SHELI_v1c04290 [Spiroplasma helicoides]|uniref:Uncharacterized protein n=1 Tax=Spiroplasma helicoides TaxID=216938 RepID=A0A1B3SKC5_9MOLU|nr:hypothetical protein SHELI_v1c04290 [Spiroplasma helicoides]